MPDWIIERSCIRWGGVEAGKKNTGKLFVHYKALQRAIWPDHDYHRWSDLLLRNFLQNQITPVLGPKSSGKTHQGAKFGLTEYFCFPECTSVVVSSTTVAALERRIWGEMKMLWAQARKRIGIDMPGNLIDHKHCIVTDDIKVDDIRDLRNGIMGIAMKQGGVEAALANFVGLKNARVIMLGDECQFMPPGFIEAISNLDSNEYFKAGLFGNPKDPFDELGKAAEPINGWTSLAVPEKTTTWPIKFKNSRAVNLVGPDSPNFDEPVTDPPRYRTLISKRTIETTEEFWGKDSLQYSSQCQGVMRTGLMARRVITRELCEQHNAYGEAEWLQPKRRKIFALDVAYGGIGGDRCVGGFIEFGLSPGGVQTLLVNPPEIVPVSVAITKPAEDQIAEWLKKRLSECDIHTLDCFYDSTGRGSIGSSFAKVFGYVIPVPVEFGGAPTKRPVREDLVIKDKDGRTRHKRCDEHFRKFVTELWFSVRYTVETGQMRGITKEIVDEGVMREWKMVADNKIEIETKEETRDRMGRSPDLFDWLATALEGARQRGFLIQRLGREVHAEDDMRSWIDDTSRKQYERIKKRQLTYA